MNHTVSESQLLEALQWRYATKAFDPNRKISAATWETLQKALVLSPSSFGLQPYKFIVVNDPATRAKLLPHAWNQRQVVDASHFIVFAARTAMTEAEIDRFLGRIMELRGWSREALAGYFKGTWATPFPASSTRPDKFYAQPGTALTVPFMHQRGHFSYGENDQVQLLALPYVGRQLEMVILLPRSREGIGPLESSLTPASLAAWTSGMRNQEVDVALPKFKMSSGFSLAQALKAMGLNDAFDPSRADFSGMDGRAHWLYLSAVLHKAYVEVNEKGTEAAAATAVVMRPMAMRIEEPPREFRADHPFLFLIRDSTTGSILFMGRVVKPED